MDQESFEAVFEREVSRARATLVVKAKEYATGGDRLHNFKKVAAFEGQTMAQALWGMQVKHLASISDMVATGTTYPQGVWDEKLGDALNYLILLQAIVFEEALINADTKERYLDAMLELEKHTNKSDKDQ